MPLTDAQRKGWHIAYNPKPIPDRRHDWDYWHDDYDGAPDGNDNRRGAAASREAAEQEILELLDGAE